MSSSRPIGTTRSAEVLRPSAAALDCCRLIPDLGCREVNQRRLVGSLRLGGVDAVSRLDEDAGVHLLAELLREGVEGDQVVGAEGLGVLVGHQPDDPEVFLAGTGECHR